MSLPALRDLRELLTSQFPDAVPAARRTVDAVATGITLLDAALPNGGFPKGRLSVWAPRGGATAVLRAACFSTVLVGERAAWIDGAGTVVGAFWTSGPMLVRPTNRANALRAAESLLRSGGFSLVVLDGVEPAGTENVRLSRAAHEGGGAVVALTRNATTASLKVSSRIEPRDYAWRRDPHGDPAAVDAATLQVHVMSLGWNRRARVVVPVVRHVVPAALDPMLPDRRGTARALRGDRPAARRTRELLAGAGVDAVGA